MYADSSCIFNAALVSSVQAILNDTLCLSSVNTSDGDFHHMTLFIEIVTYIEKSKTNCTLVSLYTG